VARASKGEPQATAVCTVVEKLWRTIAMGTARRPHSREAQVASMMMIEKTAMQSLATSTDAEFWSAEYRDRLTWLVQRIDQGVPARIN
jgi:hypothetical protein